MKISKICKTLVFLALVVAIAVPVCAMTGSGTSSDPYVIKTAEDLDAIRNDLDAFYKIGANIALNDVSKFEFSGELDTELIGIDGEEWEPIEGFSGTLTGTDTFYISGLYVSSDYKNGGLFGTLNGATISKVNIAYALIESDECAGVLAAKAEGQTTIEGCLASGSVIGKTTKTMNTAGGLVGYVGEDASVTKSVSYATVTGATSYSANVGGLAGVNYGTISECGYYGNVYGAATYYDAAIGGLAGYNAGEIANSRVAGNIGGESTAMVNDCYVGGVAGLNKGDIYNCQNDSEVSVKNFSSGDSVCAAGGITGMTVDAPVTENTNNGAVNGLYSYAGGIAGVAVSDTGVLYIDYNDNTGKVKSKYGVAGGIVGRAVAAGEGYVSIKLYVDDNYNTGAVEGNKTGNTAGETATVESASVTVYEGTSANSNTCSALTLYEALIDTYQFGSKITIDTKNVSGTSTVRAQATMIATDVDDTKLVTNRALSGRFKGKPAIVVLTKVTDTTKVEALQLDVSGLEYADGRITGEVVVKVYRPAGDTTAYNVVVGTSVGNKFVDTDFAIVEGNNRTTYVKVPVDCEAEAGTIWVNALVVGTTDNMDPVCANVEESFEA